MIKSSLIGHSIEALTAFYEHPNIPPDSIIRNFFRDRKYLGSSDRRFIGDVYFGTIKQYLRLERLAKESLGTELPHPHLMIAAYCIIFKNEAPDAIKHAIDVLPKEVKRDYPLSVYQALADRSAENEYLLSLEEDERLSLLYSFPVSFVREILAEYGSETANLLQSLNEEASTNLRVNTMLTTREALQKRLTAAGVQTTLSTLSEDALILDKRINVWDLQAFKEGQFEIQDEASQLVAPFAEIRSKKIRLLDACAGAGGKTLHLSSLMRGAGEIVATDVDPYKLTELRKRSIRSNAQNIRIVTPDRYEKFLGPTAIGTFDVVLLDVPCSGTGTIRRNPGIKMRLSDQMMNELIVKQRSILEHNTPFVKPGGALLYSTCSLLKSEGESQVSWFLELHPEYSLEAERRTHPERDHCDGFFIARLRKKKEA